MEVGEDKREPEEGLAGLSVLHWAKNANTLNALSLSWLLSQGMILQQPINFTVHNSTNTQKEITNKKNYSHNFIVFLSTTEIFINCNSAEKPGSLVFYTAAAYFIGARWDTAVHGAKDKKECDDVAGF